MYHHLLFYKTDDVVSFHTSILQVDCKKRSSSSFEKMYFLVKGTYQLFKFTVNCLPPNEFILVRSKIRSLQVTTTKNIGLYCEKCAKFLKL